MLYRVDQYRAKWKCFILSFICLLIILLLCELTLLLYIDETALRTTHIEFGEGLREVTHFV